MKITRYEDEITSIFNQIKQVQDVIDDNDFLTLIDDYRKSLTKHEYRISIVGEFSSGKSTFLNALIGRNILPHAKSETSATITYIHNTPKGSSDEDTAVVHFNDKRKDIQLNLKDNYSALDKYVRINDEIDVAHQISSVDIYTNFTNIEDNIVFVDTPGMNGVADGHRDLTLNEIQHSNASICLFHLRGVGKTDLKFIEELMKYQDKFFFIINGIDDLKAAEGETYESRLNSFRKELISSLPNLKKVDSITYGVSALNALASKDYSIPKLYESDKHNLTDEDRQRCWEVSKFDIFERDLYGYLSSNEKNRHFYLSILQKLSSLFTEKLSSVENTLTIQNTEIENCPERNTLLQMKEKMRERIKSLLTEIHYALGSRLDDLDNQAKKCLKEECSKEQRLLHDKIKQQNIETIGNFIKDNILQKDLQTFNAKLSKTLSDLMYNESNVIYNELIYKLKNAMPRITITGKTINIDQKNLYDEETKFHSSNTINLLQNKIKDYDSKLKQNNSNIIKSQQINQELSDAKFKLNSERNIYNRRINQLGDRPSTNVYEEEYEVERTGIFSSITTFFFGKKTETRICTDDSEGEYWDSQYEDIQREWYRKSDSLQKEIDYLSQKAASLNTNSLIQKRTLIETKLREYKQKLEIEIRKSEEQMKIARTSALKARINSLLKDVDLFLQEPTGELYASLLEGVQNYSVQLQKTMNEAVTLLYNEKKKEFFDCLDMMIQKVEDGPNQGNSQKSSRLQQQKNEFTKILSSINTLSLKIKK